MSDSTGYEPDAESEPSVIVLTLTDCITSWHIPETVAREIAEYIVSDASGLRVTERDG